MSKDYVLSLGTSMTDLIIRVFESRSPLGGETDDGIPVAIAKSGLQLHVNSVLEGRPAISV